MGEWSKGRRRALLREAASLSHRIDEIQLMAEPSSADHERERRLLRALRPLVNEYCDGVPLRPLSRCPFTEETVMHSIDDVDLDGLWWSHDAPGRPVEKVPASVVSFSGAMKLARRVPHTDFLVSPGPEVPFVVEDLIELDAVRAVISQHAVGAHTGYVIVYFAEPMPDALPRTNDWGLNEYSFVDADGVLRGGEREPELERRDFDLARWIERGKLLWIAPGDDSLTLRSEVEGCPYLDLEGSRALARIDEGRVWHDEEDE